MDLKYKKIITDDLSQELETFSDGLRPMISFIKSQNKQNLIGVEIGTYKGKNAKLILDNLDIKQLYCIDPWIDNELKVNGKSILEETNQRLKTYNNAWIIVEKSDNAVRYIQELVDFIYIDGNHSYMQVKKDLIHYYPKLKKHGIIGGHDFYASEMGVVQAVIEFALENNLTLYGDVIDWWFKKEVIV